MSLAEQIAKRKAEERAAAERRANPELEASLDRFIAENSEIHQRLCAMPKEELVQKLMAEEMGRAETVARRNRELEPWVRENPEIVAKVEERIKIVSAKSEKRASIVSVNPEPATRNSPGIRL